VFLKVYDIMSEETQVCYACGILGNEVSRMKILVIAGHPADMFDHCGGTLMHHIQQGDEVVCASITQGLRVHDEVIYDLFRSEAAATMPQEELDALLKERQRVKYGEVIEACHMFGIQDIRFLDYDDEILSVTPEMISKVAQLIREVRPELLITHWPYQGDTFSNHHAVTGQLALAGATAAHGINFKQNVPSWNVTQIAYMICPADFRSTVISNHGRTAHISYYVDVTDVAEIKVKALKCMHSQKYDTPGYGEKVLEMWSGNLGMTARVGYAEAFAVEHPEVGRTIPVSDHLKWMAHGDEREILERISDMHGSKTAHKLD